jgi:hypothetical protein
MAGLDVDVENALEALCPGQGRSALGRRLFLRLIECFGLVAFAPLGGRYQRTVFAPVQRKADVDSNWRGRQELLRVVRRLPSCSVLRVRDEAQWAGVGQASREETAACSEVVL